MSFSIGNRNPQAELQRSKDEARFRDEYEANYRSLRRFVSRLSADPDEADDTTQEAFARLWREIEAGTDLLNPRAWLYRVASNLVINRLKVKSRSQAHENDPGESRESLYRFPADIERTVMRRQTVRLVFERLPEPMRRCLLLYHEGLTGKEIAEVLGVKPSYVGTLVVRSHERFRRECERLGGNHELLG